MEGKKFFCPSAGASVAVVVAPFRKSKLNGGAKEIIKKSACIHIHSNTIITTAKLEQMNFHIAKGHTGHRSILNFYYIFSAAKKYTQRPTIISLFPLHYLFDFRARVFLVINLFFSSLSFTFSCS